MTKRLEYLLSRNLNDPYGKESIFFETFVVPSELGNVIPSGFEEAEELFYTMIPCDDGTEVFENYNTEGVNQNAFRIIYEKENPEKSNFFGTACRIKMGSDAKAFFLKLSKKNQNVNLTLDGTEETLNGLDVLLNRFADYCGISKSTLQAAVFFEILGKNPIQGFMDKVNSIAPLLSDWIKEGVETLERKKLTEENYDYHKFFVKPSYDIIHGFGNEKPSYKPIIPIIIADGHKVNNNGSKIIPPKGFSTFVSLANTFGEQAMGISQNMDKVEPKMFQDDFLAIIKTIEEKLEKVIPEPIKVVLMKMKKFVQLIVKTIDAINTQIESKISEDLAIFNALLCGVVNGLISLIQSIMAILAMIVEKAKIEVSKLNANTIDTFQESLEIAENFIDLITDNTVDILKGVVHLFNVPKLWKEFKDFLKTIFRKVGDYSKYFWAFFVGLIIFEIIVEIVLAAFSGGSSVVVKISAKIERVTAKAEKLGKRALRFSKNTRQKATHIYKQIEKEFLELVEAFKTGKLVQYLKKKFYHLIGESPSQDDLLVHWDEISVSGRGRRLGQTLKKADIKFLIKELKKLKVELQLLPLEGSFPIEGFFTEKGVPAMMPKSAAAMYITDGTKMKIILREQATIYEFFHEFMHYRHSQILGVKKYLSLGGKGTLGELEKEQWVFEILMKNKNYLTKSEIEHALNYMNNPDPIYGVRAKFGKSPLSINFDISKVPNIRKEIKLSEILKIK